MCAAFECGNSFSPHPLLSQECILLAFEIKRSMKEAGYKAQSYTSFAPLDLIRQWPLFHKGGLRVQEMKGSFPDSPWVWDGAGDRGDPEGEKVFSECRCPHGTHGYSLCHSPFKGFLPKERRWSECPPSAVEMALPPDPILLGSARHPPRDADPIASSSGPCLS